METLTLHDADALQKAVAILNSIQGSPFSARPLVGAALDAISNGDVGTALYNIDGARTHTITGRKETDLVAALIRQAFNLN